MKPSARNPLNFKKFLGGVAQLIEQSVHTRSVGGLNPLAATFCLIAWGFLLYANTLHAEFFFDDFSNIVTNPYVHNLAGIGELFSQYSTRFLAYLSFAVNYHFCPVDPFDSTHADREVADRDLDLVIEPGNFYHQFLFRCSQIVFGGDAIAQRLVGRLGVSARLRLIDRRI